MGAKMTHKDRHKMKHDQLPQPNLLLVFVVCLLAVGALFLAYEIVERTFLQGVSPSVIHALHILRGVSAATIASVLATLVLLRQTQDRASDVVLTPSKKSWKHRLQNVRLRTKIVIPMVVLAVLPSIGVGIFTISRMQKSLRQGAIQRVDFDTASKAQAIQEFLQEVQQDLLFLSRIKGIREFAVAEAEGSPKLVNLLRRKVEQEFLIFSQGKRAYYQVRYLNSAGHEVVRLNIKNGLAAIVPSVELQDKSNRYYVKAALALESGQTYVSPMDLNLEHGEVELPPRGVIRYVTPVSGDEGSGRGLLVINVYADYLLSLIGPLAPGTEAWLLDQGGTYLGYVGDSVERRSLFSLEKRRQLAQDYSPEEIRAILGHSASGLSAKTGGALLFSDSISIDQQDSQRDLTLMIGYPQAPINAPILQLTTFVSVVLTFVVAIAAILGVLIGNYLARPIVRLQHATRDIAAGNLEKRVHIATGDEIERLANDFNVMTGRLRKAQDELSQWNLKLEQEVEHQTAVLRRLQSGMAHTDKLASIGQITAGVMHEVGNPLAAIKTKIQVAEESGDLCGECQGLLVGILREVDRLSAFLQSFSRLARLGGHQIKETVNVVEVAHSVIALVSEDLKRNDVALRCEVGEHVPTVRGVADQLRQLLMNLILNAADASRQDGEVVVKITRVAMAPNTSGSLNGVSVKVIDGGEGIPQDILDRMWDPFFTTKDQGTGLGLAISRRIVEDHGGTIRVNSEKGKGTAVEVTFPRHTTSESTPTHSEEQP